jgi:HK97 gp10 family phage protein
VAREAVQGSAELKKTFQELTNMQSSEWKSTMRAAVRDPMNKVMKRAKANLSRISPGDTPAHTTYLGRLVTAGFAMRSVRMVVRVVARAGRAIATLGVRREAFYVLSFFELGTSKIPRQPWLTPALEQSTNDAVREVGAAMRKRIIAIARRRANKARAK